MSKLAFAIALSWAVLMVLGIGAQNVKDSNDMVFSFVGARDFARFFTPAPTPIVIDSTAKELESSATDFSSFAKGFNNPFASFIHDKSPESLAFAPSTILRINAKAFEKELASRKTLLQAQAVLFQAMRSDQTKRDDKEIYLTLAMLEYRLNGFYHLHTLVAYIRAYLHAGGDEHKLPSQLAPLLVVLLNDQTIFASLVQILPALLRDPSQLHSNLFIALDSQSHSFVRTFTQGARGCVGIVTQDSKAFVLCLPPFIDEPLLLPFDEKLYIIAGSRIYLVQSPITTQDLPRYATLVYEEKNRPKICLYAAELLDTNRQEHLASDLARAGYGVDSSKRALTQWQKDIVQNDELVEYLGYFDVFNDGYRVPLARTHTMVTQGLLFYEAFVLDPNTLQADILLSHPSMVIGGRIASLFFIQHKGEILGCVRDEAHREEKLFRFHRDAPPELVAHNRLEKSLRTIHPLLLPVKARQNLCSMEKKGDGDTRYGLLTLGEYIITESNLCDQQMQKALAQCASFDKENELECRLKAINEAMENVL